MLGITEQMEPGIGTDILLKRLTTKLQKNEEIDINKEVKALGNDLKQSMDYDLSVVQQKQQKMYSDLKRRIEENKVNVENQVKQIKMIVMKRFKNSKK